MKLFNFLLPALLKANEEVLAENKPEHDLAAAEICKNFYSERLGQVFKMKGFDHIRTCQFESSSELETRQRRYRVSQCAESRHDLRHL